MSAVAVLLLVLVGLLHLYFLVLEMFQWTRPLGLKTFRNTPEKAETTRALRSGAYPRAFAARLEMPLRERPLVSHGANARVAVARIV